MIQDLKNQKLKSWIEEMAELCQPEKIHLCDGSQSDYDQLIDLMLKQGTLIKLKRPGSYLARSNPEDVSRSEESTFICSEKESDAGPTNNWKDPEVMKARLKTLFKGCMKGRTLYVVPYCMGPLGSPISHIGVEITDSPYVAVSMMIMTRVGSAVLDLLGNGFFVPGLHSVGVPLEKGQTDTPWPCNSADRVIAHFPETREIFSFGSGYGGNALLGKKCFALRIASVMARDQGWMAEHMLILGITNPEGVKRYMCAAFPSACGKTNLAMITPSLPGWKVETVGDDIAWMKYDEEGQLRAINPEKGFFGVAPGTSWKSNPNAMASIEKNTLFTNVALTKEGDIWWEGMSEPAPSPLIDWLGKEWKPESGEKAAQPNSRFTCPAVQCPCIDPLWEDPKGVPISAIIFGGRRRDTIPLVTESFSWQHGVFFGASVSSETTAAAVGATGRVRHDPFAMLPFCGYNMGDYFAHWLQMGEGKKRPLIYQVNWFLKDADGRFIWPGFGENSRVLKWIFQRCEGQVSAETSPVGYLPHLSDFDFSGLNMSAATQAALFAVVPSLWQKEIESCQTYFKIFKDRFPEPLRQELLGLQERLNITA